MSESKVSPERIQMWKRDLSDRLTSVERAVFNKDMDAAAKVIQSVGDFEPWMVGWVTDGEFPNQAAAQEVTQQFLREHPHASDPWASTWWGAFEDWVNAKIAAAISKLFEEARDEQD